MFALVGISAWATKENLEAMKSLSTEEPSVSDTSFCYVTIPNNSGWESSEYGPYELVCNNGLTESIYTATEIGQTGSISSIAYNLVKGSALLTDSIKVYMGLKSDAYFKERDSYFYEPLEIKDMTLVYSCGPITLGLNPGWEELKLQDEFYYDGSANLVVVVCRFAKTFNYEVKYAVTSSSTKNAIMTGADRYICDPMVQSPYIQELIAGFTGIRRPNIRIGFNEMTIRDFSVDGIKYIQTSKNTCKLIDGSAATGNISIPDSVKYEGKNYAVIEIGDSAFCGNKNIAQLTLSNSIQHIRNYAFAKSGITNTLHIPSSVVSIGDYAFSGTNPSQIRIEDNHKFIQIGASAFGTTAYYSQYESVYLGRTVISETYSDYWKKPFFGSYISDLVIGGSSYYFPEIWWDTNLKKLTLGSNVHSVKDNTFHGYSINELRIEDSSDKLSLGSQSNYSASTYFYGAFKDCKIKTLYLGRDLSYAVRESSSTYPGYGVPFENLTTLKDITVGPMVKTLDNYMFNGCTGLKTVNIMDSDMPLTLGTKNNYQSLFADSKLTAVSIGRNLTLTKNIGIFENQDSLQTVDFNKNIKTIYKNQFSGCTSLQKVVLSDSLKYIGSAAFDNCSLLGNIIIPNSVDTIGSVAFGGCYLKSLRIQEGENPLYLGSDISADTLFLGRNIKNNYTYTPFYRNLCSVTLGSNITSIPNYFFNSCTNLKSITIPNSVITIGDNAFTGTSITSLNIPKSVTSTGNNSLPYRLKKLIIEDSAKPLTLGYNYATDQGLAYNMELDSLYIGRDLNWPTTIKGVPFENNSKLRKVEFGDSVTTLASSIFKGCNNLTTARIGKSIKSIDGTFDNTNLDTLYISAPTCPSGYPGYIQESHGSLSLRRNVITYVPSGTGTAYRSRWGYCCLIIDDNEDTVCIEMEQPGQLASKIIQKGIMPKDIVKLKIKGRLNDTDWQLMQSSTMKYLSYLDLSEAETDSIPANLYGTQQYYYNNSTISTVIFPANLKRIGDYAFSNCIRLNQELSFSSTLEKIGKGALRNTKCTLVSVPAENCKIDSCAFYDCKNIKSATIGSNAILGNSAFYNCNTMTGVSLGDNAVIGTMAFKNCSKLSNLHLSESSYIGSQSFYGCYSLKDITIPGTGTVVGEKAFYDLQLKNLYFNEGVDSIGNYAFYDCDSLICNINCPSTLKNIGNYAFYNCKNIKGINFSNETKSIGNYAFYGCALVDSINLPAQLETIGDNAFSNCTALKKVEFHQNINSCGNNAFSNCSNIEKIVAHWMKPIDVNSSTFHNTAYTNCQLYIPLNSCNNYLLAQGWKNFAKIKEVSMFATSIIFDKTVLDIAKGEKDTIKTTVIPKEFASTYLHWISSNGSVATVDANGVVTAVAAGKATITATTTDGSNISATCEVRVKELDTDIDDLDDVIYVKGGEGFAGQTLTLPMRMKHNIQVSGFQVNMYLPDGFTTSNISRGDDVRDVADNDEYIYSFNHSVKDDGSTFFLCYSNNNVAMQEGDIEVARVTINIPADAEAGDYPIILKAEEMAYSSNPPKTVDYIKTSIAVKDYITGDANCDGVASVGDITAIVNFLLGNTPYPFNKRAADTNDDGKVSVADITRLAKTLLTASGKATIIETINE